MKKVNNKRVFDGVAPNRPDKVLVLFEPATANADVVVRHQLGRLPLGYVVVRAILPDGTTAYTVYESATGPAFTETSMTLRSNVAEATYLLEVF